METQLTRCQRLMGVAFAILMLAGCSVPPPAPTLPPTPPPTALPTIPPTEPPTAAPPTAVPSPVPTAVPAAALPQITAVQVDLPEVPRYEAVEMQVTVQADYVNAFDARQVRLDGIFRGPGGQELKVPGFWDDQQGWRLRFTPSQEGEWQYQLVVTDTHGASQPAAGKLTVTASDQHGWLQVGQWVNPAYSPRYLVYHDGTPFYGVGHCDALNILVGGFSLQRGVGLFNDMQKAGENYVVWWPFYSNSIFSGSYDQYASANMSIIDTVVKDAQKKQLFLIFTVWDHPELRGPGHAWGAGRWDANGFSKLGDIQSFFTSAEAWAWQENLYRYIIARWGYSPAIGMWLTVSEINGTSAYDQTDPWHTKVNAYFAANDPYRHPTTASMSGDTDWPAGFKAMDAPQMHIYDFKNGSLGADAVKAAQILAHWTSQMWQEAAKPNWVGEFGVPGNTYYPELFHNAIWAALASGAALTPAEWNSGNEWMEMTPEMYADNGRLAKFVADLPLAKLDPAPLQVSSSDPQVRGWGLAGKAGGLVWVQDFSLEGKTIDAVRKGQATRQGVQVQLQGLATGTYTLLPYDTWQGQYLAGLTATCTAGQPCAVSLPAFKADLAFKIEAKP